LDQKIQEYGNSLSDPDLDPCEMDRILSKMGEDQHRFEELGGYMLEADAQMILSGLGILPEEQAKPLHHFSGGWKMRIALARILILQPDLILMDEPTNYLDMETIIWLENWLRKFKGAVLLTTHDRDFMNRVVNKIIEISQTKVRSFTGNYDFYEQEKEILLRNNEAEYNRQKSMLKKEENFIARFKARASHASQVQSRVKKIDKIEKVEIEPAAKLMKIELPQIERGGNDVVSIKDLGKSWPNPDNTQKHVFSGLNAMVVRGDRIAVTGINGAGKSTFLKVISNQTPPSRGAAQTGPSITMGYFGQFTLEMLNPENTIMQELMGRLAQVTEAGVRNILAAFLFTGDDVFKKIKVLSGGEKARVVLSWLLSTPFNCLILDEPTNHLDINSRQVLLDALLRYEGTLLFVSHDRYFLRALTNRVFQVDKGSIKVFEGDYNYYLECISNG
jgi:ATP-binding cassette subfamily F protein 3